MRCFQFIGLFSLLCLSSSAASAQSLIAFFDFNDGFSVADETPSIAHAATLGAGTLHQQRADTDGNGKGGLTYVNAGLGIDTSGALDDRAMAWDDISKSGDNDAEFFIETSTLGFTNIQIRMDVRGNDEGTSLAEFDFKYDPNPLEDVTDPGDVTGTIKDFQGGTSTTFLNNQGFPGDDTFQTLVVNLTGVTDVENQSVVTFRFDDFDGNDALRIDNVLVTGTAVPEPSSLLSLSAAGVVAFARRRRRQA